MGVGNQVLYAILGVGAIGFVLFAAGSVSAAVHGVYRNRPAGCLVAIGSLVLASVSLAAVRYTNGAWVLSFLWLVFFAAATASASEEERTEAAAHNQMWAAAAWETSDRLP